jgi:hypothetical protein
MSESDRITYENERDQLGLHTTKRDMGKEREEKERKNRLEGKRSANRTLKKGVPERGTKQHHGRIENKVQNESKRTKVKDILEGVNEHMESEDEKMKMLEWFPFWIQWEMEKEGQEMEEEDNGYDDMLEWYPFWSQWE